MKIIQFAFYSVIFMVCFSQSVLGMGEEWRNLPRKSQFTHQPFSEQDIDNLKRNINKMGVDENYLRESLEKAPFETLTFINAQSQDFNDRNTLSQLQKASGKSELENIIKGIDEKKKPSLCLTSALSHLQDGDLERANMVFQLIDNFEIFENNPFLRFQLAIYYLKSKKEMEGEQLLGTFSYEEIQSHAEKLRLPVAYEELAKVFTSTGDVEKSSFFSKKAFDLDFRRNSTALATLFWIAEMKKEAIMFRLDAISSAVKYDNITEASLLKLANKLEVCKPKTQVELDKEEDEAKKAAREQRDREAWLISRPFQKGLDVVEDHSRTITIVVVGWYLFAHKDDIFKSIVGIFWGPQH